MNIRMKPKVYTGLTKSGNPVSHNLRAIEGCLGFHERRTLEAKLNKAAASGNIELTTKLQKGLKAVLIKAANDAKAHGLSSNPKPCLSMHLNHGDIVFMHGNLLQSHFEVSVYHCLQ
jgi:hypothetical protein